VVRKISQAIAFEPVTTPRQLTEDQLERASCTAALPSASPINK
jgi:hypothetical protein